MGRPGFVLEVDDRTPPLLVPDGDRFRLEKFPLGTRVIYPAESLARGARPRRSDQCCTRRTARVRAALGAAGTGNAADDRLR